MATTVRKSDGTTYTIAENQVNIGTKDNPNIKTFDVPTVQSSELARNASQDAMNKLNTIQQGARTQQTTKKPVEPKQKPVVVNEQQDGYSEQLKQINASADAEVSSINNIFDTINTNLNASSNGLIQSIRNTFARRVEQMKAVNEASLRGQTNVGIVSGRARYAPELQTSILSAEERAGIERIADLNAQEESLVAEAQASADAKKMQSLFKQMEMLGDVQKSKMQAIADLNKNMIEFEKLNIQKSQEQRQLIKDNLANMETTADSIAAALVNSFTGDAKTDEALIDQASQEYGLDPNFLIGAISRYKQSQQKDLPADLREYDELVARGQYKGSFLSFQRAKKAASSVASGDSNKILSDADAARYDLPQELVGRSIQDIIEDLYVEKIPDWFKKSQARAGLPADQANWKIFRDSPDMMVLKKTLDINKAESGSGLVWGNFAPAGTSAGIPESEE